MTAAALVAPVCALPVWWAPLALVVAAAASAHLAWRFRQLALAAPALVLVAMAGVVALWALSPSHPTTPTSLEVAVGLSPYPTLAVIAARWARRRSPAWPAALTASAGALGLLCLFLAAVARNPLAIGLLLVEDGVLLHITGALDERPELGAWGTAAAAGGLVVATRAVGSPVAAPWAVLATAVAVWIAGTVTGAPASASRWRRMQGVGAAVVALGWSLGAAAARGPSVRFGAVELAAVMAVTAMAAAEARWFEGPWWTRHAGVVAASFVGPAVATMASATDVAWYTLALGVGLVWMGMSLADEEHVADGVGVGRRVVVAGAVLAAAPALLSVVVAHQAFGVALLMGEGAALVAAGVWRRRQASVITGATSVAAGGLTAPFEVDRSISVFVSALLLALALLGAASTASACARTGRRRPGRRGGAGPERRYR